MSTHDAPSRKTPDVAHDADARREAIGKLPDRPSGWLFAAVIGVIACIALIGSFEFHYQIRRWPLILSVFVLACLALYVVEQAMLVRKVHAAGLGEARSPVEPDYRPRETAITAIATAAFGLFLLAAYFFSFLVATLVFVPAYMWVAGVRSPTVLVGVTAGMLVSVWFMFGRILFVPVEAGRYLDLHWLAP
jgi:hypothetical protein